MNQPRASLIPAFQSDADQALEVLLGSHNLEKDYEPFTLPKLAIVTCMDFRIQLRLPRNFAFVLRTGGANIRPIETYLAFSVARTGIHAIAIIGHTDCAMEKPDPYVVDELPTDNETKIFYRSQIASLAIRDAREYTLAQAKMLEERLGLPGLPLIYDVETHKLELL